MSSFATPKCPAWIEQTFHEAFAEACDNTHVNLTFTTRDADPNIRVREAYRAKSVLVDLAVLQRRRDQSPEDRASIVVGAARAFAAVINDHDRKLFDGFEIIPDVYEEEVSGVKVQKSRFMKRDKRWGGSFRGMKDEESAIYRGWTGSDPEVAKKRQEDRDRNRAETERKAAEAAVKEQEERRRKQEERRVKAQARLEAKKARLQAEAEERAAHQVASEKFYEGADDYGVF